VFSDDFCRFFLFASLQNYQWFVIIATNISGAVLESIDAQRGAGLKPVLTKCFLLRRRLHCAGWKHQQGYSVSKAQTWGKGRSGLADSAKSVSTPK
jgi:hypothetical protein